MKTIIRVSSSDLHSIGYDKYSSVLTIRFNSGGLYEYYHVPASVFEGLKIASSKGKYFHRNIKDKYVYRRIG